MIQNNAGFIFEAKEDINNNIGVKESYNVKLLPDVIKLTITITLDSYGKICVPAYNDISLGFKPLNTKIFNQDDLIKFIKSRKPYYGKLGEFALIASGTIVLDRNTNKCINSGNMHLYAVKKVTFSKQFSENDNPVLICEKLSTLKEINSFPVSDTIYNNYMNSLCSCIENLSVKSREEFLGSLILK